MNREWKYFHLFPSRCHLQQKIILDGGMSANCLVFGLSGLSPLTQLDHQNTSENCQRSAYLNCSALKYQDRPAHYSNSTRPLPPLQAKLLADTLFFHQRSLKQPGQAFPVGGTWGEKTFLGKAPPLPVSATSALHCLGLFLFYTLLLLSESAQWVEIPRWPLLCANNNKNHKVMVSEKHSR